jgi:hypothetical protein
MARMVGHPDPRLCLREATPGFDAISESRGVEVGVSAPPPVFALNSTVIANDAGCDAIQIGFR